MRSSFYSKLEGDFKDNTKVYNYLLLSAHKANMTVLQATKHEFYPQGLTAVVLLAESHITLHTYPEENVAYIDCFTCGDISPETAVREFCILMEVHKSTIQGSVNER